MPIKKFQRKKKFVNKKQPIVKKIRSIDRKVKNIQKREELKYADTSMLNDASEAGYFQLLNGVPTDDQTDTSKTQYRIGNEITMTSLQFRYKIESMPEALKCTLFRMIMFVDRQPNGAAPANIGSILDADNDEYVYAPYNRTTQKRYKILYDKVLTFNDQVIKSWDASSAAVLTVDTVSTGKYVKGKIPLNRVVKFNGASVSGTIASIVTNALWVLFIAEDTTFGQAVTGTARLYFKDD
jgi:hypothetical protein